MKKTDVIKLADEKEYTVSTLNVGDLIEIEKKYGSLSVDITKVEAIIYWLWLGIKKAHKELKLEELYELIDAPYISDGGLEKVFKVMSALNGWDKTTDPNVESPAGVKKKQG